MTKLYFGQNPVVVVFEVSVGLKYSPSKNHPNKLEVIRSRLGNERMQSGRSRILSDICKTWFCKSENTWPVWWHLTTHSETRIGHIHVFSISRTSIPNQSENVSGNRLGSNLWGWFRMPVKFWEMCGREKWAGAKVLISLDIWSGNTKTFIGFSTAMCLK